MYHRRLYHDPAMRMLMRNFMNQEQETERRCRWTPAANITEDEKNIYLELAVPGFSKEDIKMSVEGDTLKIYNEREKEGESKEQTYRRCEFGHGDFSRSFMLGEKIDQDGIQAEYNNGILKVTFPRKEEVKLKKEIQIA
jgi:HSP20 family protein